MNLELLRYNAQRQTIRNECIEKGKNMRERGTDWKKEREREEIAFNWVGYNWQCDISMVHWKW